MRNSSDEARRSRRSLPSTVKPQPGAESHALESLPSSATIAETHLTWDPDVVGLEPVDRGRGAWAFVAAGTALEFFCWGFSLSFGIFQGTSNWWSAPGGDFEGASPVAISAVGTTALSIQYASMLYLVYVFRRWPHTVVRLTWAALGLCFLSLLLSSFATALWQLVILQGVLFGMGAGATYAPVMLLIPQWFQERRGLAVGVIFGGNGIAGFAFPLLLGRLLHVVEWRWTLRIFACAMLAVSAISLPYIRPRLPLPPKQTPRAPLPPISYAWARSPLFVALLVTFFVQSIALLPVSLYIPVFSTTLGQSPFNGQLALALFNLAGCLGIVAMGALSDRVLYVGVMAASAFASSLCAFVLWGLASSIQLLFAFSVLFGCLSAGYSSVWPVAASDLAGKAAHLEATVIFGVFSCAKGLSAIVGPAIAGSLRHETSLKSTYGAFGFAPMIVFVGSAMLLTTLCSAGCAVVRSKMGVR